VRIQLGCYQVWRGSRWRCGDGEESALSTVKGPGLDMNLNVCLKPQAILCSGGGR
jgi:hypothetical protein